VPEYPELEMAVRYLPALELGGDFYDFLPYADGRLAIAVGDVAGKGSSAALLATLGIGILREHTVHQVSNPAELLADLNCHLQVAGETGRFIAMAFAVYDAATRDLSVANAGFPQPILVRQGRAIPIQVAGVPLGLLADSTYEAARIPLEAGDAVVFCSDGIHEQTNDLDEEFGMERLLARLAEAGACDSANAIASQLVRAIEEHAGGASACQDCKDDRTIVVIRFAGESC
jgi:sigma-B regulation protein RsbU (phosphoserine phosphatase)